MSFTRLPRAHPVCIDAAGSSPRYQEYRLAHGYVPALTAK
jgi:hypothetical protein